MKTIMDNVLLKYVKSLFLIAKRRVIFSLFLMVFLGLTEGMGLLILIPLLTKVGLHTQEGTVGKLSQFVMSFLSSFGIPLTLISILCIYVFIVGMNALLVCFQTISNNYLETNYTHSLREKLYKAVSNSSWMFISQNRSSNFIQIITSEIDRIGIGTYFFLQLIVNTIITLVYLIMALQLSTIATLITSFCGVTLLFFFKGKIKEVQLRGEELSKEMSSFYSTVIEHFNGIKTVKSYNTEDRNCNIFSNISCGVAQTYVNATGVQAKVKFWFDIGTVLILSSILYISLNVLHINTAGILLLLYFFVKVMRRISAIQQNYHQIIGMLPAFANVTLIQEQCENAAEVKFNKTNQIVTMNHSIQIKNISFSYQRENFAIKNLNITIRKGEFVSIVGPSGSGKSTVADLIVGLLVPCEGSVLVDDVLLTPEKAQSWRNQVGYVNQDTFLFHDTIRANLLWACPNASEAEIKQAIRLSALENFIFLLPNGIDTIVGDRGVLLSGGERQRLALARALLRKPSLLILDEATSSLDSENEKHIQNAIEKLHGHLTILAITHRLSTIQNADIIYVLEKGNLVESGTWGTLSLNENSRFKKMCKAQDLKVKILPTL